MIDKVKSIIEDGKAYVELKELKDVESKLNKIGIAYFVFPISKNEVLVELDIPDMKKMDYVGNNPLFLISGPSGCGKTVVTEAVLKNKIITTTTRERRPGETNGKDYYFLSEDEFHSKVDNDEFVEWASYVKHSYGTTKEEFEKLVNDYAYIICEYEGLQNFKKAYSRVVSIFIYCTKEESKERSVTIQNIR